jgi:L-rhamnose mutarotase
VTRRVLTVDLVPDRRRIEEYLTYHRRPWPEVVQSLRKVGIRSMDIYRLGRRLVMVMEARKGLDLRAAMAKHRKSSPRCAEWETLMRTFQRRPPGARRGEVWARMEQVFRLGRPTGRRAARRRSGQAADWIRTSL